jgi:hypothetical protein
MHEYIVHTVAFILMVMLYKSNERSNAQVTVINEMKKREAGQDQEVAELTLAKENLQSERDSLLELTKDLKRQLEEDRANSHPRLADPWFDEETNQFFVSKLERALEGNFQVEYPEDTEVMYQF